MACFLARWWDLKPDVDCLGGFAGILCFWDGAFGWLVWWEGLLMAGSPGSIFGFDAALILAVGGSFASLFGWSWS